MKEFFTPSIIAAGTSLIISLITLYQFFRSQDNQKKQFEKGLNRNLTSRLYELRLEHYPIAFEITDEIFRDKGGNFDVEKLKDIREQLIYWKKGIISLIISVEAKDSYYILRDAIQKNPAMETRYSKEQIDKILNAKHDFRRQLRRDLGFMYREEKERRAQ